MSQYTTGFLWPTEEFVCSIWKKFVYRLWVPQVARVIPFGNKPLPYSVATTDPFKSLVHLNRSHWPNNFDIRKVLI